MAKIKLTKNELRAQERHKAQLERYLPTLQLKKAMLQTVIYNAREEIAQLQTQLNLVSQNAMHFAELLSDMVIITPSEAMAFEEVRTRKENIAGVEVPIFESVVFPSLNYYLLETPPWTEGVIEGLRHLTTFKQKIEIGKKRKELLEKELREVTIRVNLFEKILIPRAKEAIKKIKVFLGDQLLTAVGQVKKAKEKIEERAQIEWVEEEAVRGRGYAP